jgi:hypothetical protein
MPADRALDGKSLVPLLKAGKGDRHQPYVYHTWDRYFPNPDRRWSISDGRWKLLGMVGNQTQASPQHWRLFDLESDPGETENMASQHPTIVKRLREEFVRWFEDVTRGIDYAPVRIPVGPPGQASVEISPSWATWKGDHIQYTFDGYDWDTIDGWRLPGEQARWRLEVQTAGTYEVVLAYGCRPVDAGGILRLQIGDEALEHRVRPTATAEQFETFHAGNLKLSQGEAELVTEVLSTPGRELMRLNKIILRRRP